MPYKRATALALLLTACYPTALATEATQEPVESPWVGSVPAIHVPEHEADPPPDPPPAAPRNPMTLALEGFVSVTHRPDLTGQAECIALAESGGNPEAVSATGDHGMFQINALTWQRFFGDTWSSVYDPAQNGMMAGVIFNRAGQDWAPWSTRGSCE